MIIRKSRILSVLFLAGTFLLSSCVGTYTVKKTRTIPFLPDDVYISLDDLEYMGEMEISVAYSKYLGIFSVERLINGQEVSRRTVNSVTLYGFSSIHLDPMLHRALYDAHIKFPDADYLVPGNVIEETEKMFMGVNTRKTATIRAFKLKL
jgi:hypothetical protein